MPEPEHREPTDDSDADGVQMIPVTTPAGTFRVRTRRVGDHPRLKLLLLHGGPGANHEYLRAFDDHLPAAGIEYIYYDQLGSAGSDQPEDASLWELERFVDEVEQVRTALRLDGENFVLLGHSWGGILATEYALAHPDRLKGLVISNMMADVPAYNAYAETVLKPAMDPDAVAEIEALEAAGAIDDPRYEELLYAHHYVEHVLRLPVEQWPEPVTRSFAAINPDIYVSMQGPSELGIAAEAKLAHWSRWHDLGRIDVPTLTIGARHDTMDPDHMAEMATRFPHGEHVHCPEGSHLAMWDDPDAYFPGLLAFLERLDRTAG